MVLHISQRTSAQTDSPATRADIKESCIHKLGIFQDWPHPKPHTHFLGMVFRKNYAQEYSHPISLNIVLISGLPSMGSDNQELVVLFKVLSSMNMRSHRDVT